MTRELASILREGGVTRVSLGAQSFTHRLLDVLERVATPDDVRRAFHTLRDVSFDNVSLDLIYGIPGQEPADLDRDLAEALALAPDHLSLYELEAKPGTRFTHAWGVELERQSEAMEGYFERVVETLTGAGYRWYETANFCLVGERAGGRDLRSRHNLGTWHGRDYLGVGIGAVSTLGRQRRRNAASIGRYIEALTQSAGGDGTIVGVVDPPREIEPLEARTKAQERVMLGLRLDEPLPLAGLEDVLDRAALDRMTAGGLAIAGVDAAGGETLTLTARGRFLGDAVTAELLADRGRGWDSTRRLCTLDDGSFATVRPGSRAANRPRGRRVRARATRPAPQRDGLRGWTSSIAHTQAAPGFRGAVAARDDARRG